MVESDSVLTNLQDMLVYLIPQLNKFPHSFTGQAGNCSKGLENPTREVEPAQGRDVSVAMQL